MCQNPSFDSSIAQISFKMLLESQNLTLPKPQTIATLLDDALALTLLALQTALSSLLEFLKKGSLKSWPLLPESVF